MARLPIIINNGSRLLLRSYCATASSEKELVKMHLTAVSSSATKKVNTEKMKDCKNVFWMRDPKSGFWIPETHFEEVNVVDLRNQLLP
ncbi:uncharacterized protein LOC124915497 [Impatiens glandulifera]|uniref:uncharacterized protein LOC124915497 n=1 Tax=Impatiens glandulifera TaxID=253017 RepID=UPI001FB0A815|nr:uncharacterized protein LOC124915497 [Impatiens glandulifera]